MNQDLIKKLRIQGGQDNLVVGSPEGYKELLGLEDDAITFVMSAEEAGVFLREQRRVDYLQWFVTRSEDVRDGIRILQPLVMEDVMLWICYPKQTSKVKSDLNRDILFGLVNEYGLEGVALVSIDATWSAMRFRAAGKSGATSRPERSPEAGRSAAPKDRVLDIPDEVTARLNAHPTAAATFAKLSYTHKKEYVTWITGAKKEETRLRRLDKMTEMLEKGLKSPSGKEG